MGVSFCASQREGDEEKAYIHTHTHTHEKRKERNDMIKECRFD
jgi:hypothetical protein